MANEPTKSRLGKLAVGLAVDCDAEDEFWYAMFQEHLPDAQTLPFVAVLTSDGRWVDGVSGYQDAAALGTFLDRVEKSPMFDANAETRATLKKLADAAEAAAKKRQWAKVIALGKSGAKLYGRCPERDRLRAAIRHADRWLQEQFDIVIADAVAGRKLANAKKVLLSVRRAFKGEPAAELASRGIDAIKKLNRVRSIEARGNPKDGLRDEAAEEFEGTPWTAMFGIGKQGKSADMPHPAKDK